jgi:hypothetical protein
MRTLLLVCGLLLAIVGLGVLIGLTASPPSRAENSASSIPSNEPAPLEGKVIRAAEPKPKLYLPGVAKVDLRRVVAAHPWTKAHEELLADRISEAQSLSDTQERGRAKRFAEEEQRANRGLVVSDIQKIVAAYAVTNELKLVFDCSASLLPDRPVVEYPSNEVEFSEITGASGVKDITRAILQVLALERPNNDLHWRRR